MNDVIFYMVIDSCGKVSVKTIADYNPSVNVNQIKISGNYLDFNDTAFVDKVVNPSDISLIVLPDDTEDDGGLANFLAGYLGGQI
jgi:hypothetical protein